MIMKKYFYGVIDDHSNFSFDAYSFGNTALGPDKAYEFTRVACKGAKW